MPPNLVQYTAASLDSLFLALLFIVPASHDSPIHARIGKHEVVQDPSDQQPIGSPHEIKLLSACQVVSALPFVSTGRVD
jgi:hypothetical protein